MAAVRSAFASCRAPLAFGVSLLVLLCTLGQARANQDDVPLPLPRVTGLFRERSGWLTAGQSRADIAVYPRQGSSHHRWHGRVAVDTVIVQANSRSLVRLGLAMHTVADDRNDIAFRLTRLYYDAFAAYEHRLGESILYAGYRHRCSHGADTAVPGRVLIRSGPELGYRVSHQDQAWTFAGHVFGHASLIAQNTDLSALPRALLAGSGELRLDAGHATYFAAFGVGVALTSRSASWTVGPFDPYDRVRLQVLPAFALGVDLEGEAATFRLKLHAQRILDSGIGPLTHPQNLLALELGFVH